MDKLNVYTLYALRDKAHTGILYLMIFVYIIFLTSTTPKEWNTIFSNVITQFILLFIGIIIATYNPNLGIIYMIALTLTFASVYNTYITNKEILENFTVVENDINKIITIQRNSLLNRLENLEEDVVGVWGCSAWGREMGLCKI